MAKKVSTKKGEPFIGIDLGSGDPISVGFVAGRNPDGTFVIFETGAGSVYQKTIDPFTAYAESDAVWTQEFYQQHRKRQLEYEADQRRRTELRLDFKVGTTQGSERKKWLKAQLHWKLGVGMIAPWPKTQLPIITLQPH